jgi:hypothetical protein
MATPGSVNLTGLFPELQTDALAVQRQQALAQMLMQEGNKPIDINRSSGRYVIPISPFEALSKVAQAGLGAYAMNKADERSRALGMHQQTALASMFGGNQQSAPVPNAVDLVGSGAPTVENAQKLEQALSAGTPSSGGGAATARAPGAGSLALSGMGPRQAMTAFMLDPSAYMSAYLKQVSPDPTEIARLAREAGIREGTPEYQQLIRGNITKQNYIAPTVTRPGSLVIPPGETNPANMIYTPDASNGMSLVYDPNVPGGFRSVPIQGFIENRAQLAGATRGAEQANTVGTMDVGGRPTVNYYGNMIGAPPAAANGTMQPQAPAPAPMVPGQDGVSVGAVPPPSAIQTSSIPSNTAADLANAPPDVLLAREREIMRANAARGQGTPMPGGRAIPSGGVAVPAPRGAGVQGITAAEREYDTTRAKNYADAAEGYTKQYDTANEMRSNVGVLRDLDAQNVVQGRLGEQISALKGIAQTFGINIAGLPAEDAMRAIMSQMSLQVKGSGNNNLMAGSVSDFEQRKLQSMVPSLSQSREGRAILYSYFEKMADRQMQVSDLAARYEQIHGRLDAGFETDKRAEFRNKPLFTPEEMRGIEALANRQVSPTTRQPAQQPNNPRVSTGRIQPPPSAPTTRAAPAAPTRHMLPGGVWVEIQ